VARYLRKEELELPEADPGPSLMDKVPHLPYGGIVLGGAGFIHLAEAGQTFDREDLKTIIECNLH
jgi:hypothetical protein